MFYDNEENHMVIGNFVDTPDIELNDIYEVSFMHDYDNDTEKATLELNIHGVVN